MKLERWQGPPRISKVKQYEIVCLFIQPGKQIGFVYLVCLGIKKVNEVNEELSLLIKKKSPKLHNAPLNLTYYISITLQF